jgi:DNA-directed RNA polymerase specialized sigma24 family protein
MSHATPDESSLSLLNQCLAGESPAWEEFTGWVRQTLTHQVARRLGRLPDDPDVQDAVQEVFLLLLKEDRRLLRSFDPHRGRLGPYLGQRARDQAGKWKRRRGQFLTAGLLLGKNELVDPRPDPTWAKEWVEDLVKHVIPQLPPRERQFVQSKLPDQFPDVAAPPLSPANRRKVKERAQRAMRELLDQ